MDIKDKIGLRIKELRTEKNITQKAVAWITLNLSATLLPLKSTNAIKYERRSKTLDKR